MESKHMDIYIALRSVPDYSARAPAFYSAHETLEGAIKALYPESPNFQKAFIKWASTKEEVWEGPDGFGMVKKVTLLP